MFLVRRGQRNFSSPSGTGWDWMPVSEHERLDDAVFSYTDACKTWAKVQLLETTIIEQKLEHASHPITSRLPWS